MAINKDLVQFFVVRQCQKYIDQTDEFIASSEYQNLTGEEQGVIDTYKSELETLAGSYDGLMNFSWPKVPLELK